MKWIQSFSGIVVTPLDIRQSQVRIVDIAQALSNKCRFTGHSNSFYSVAEHCVLGSLQFVEPANAMAFLLHEVSEAYLPDVATPIKSDVYVTSETGEFISWKSLERHHANVILAALGLSRIEIGSQVVKAMDLRMLERERLTLFDSCPKPWDTSSEPSRARLQLWSPERAARAFLVRFHDLKSRL